MAQSQLLAALPFVAAVVFALALAYACDKTGKRSIYIIGQAMVCIAGLMMTGYAKQNKVSKDGQLSPLI